MNSYFKNRSPMLVTGMLWTVSYTFSVLAATSTQL